MTGDEVYGRDTTLRVFLEQQSTGYVLKIPCSFRITLPTGQKIRADHAARMAPARASVGPCLVSLLPLSGRRAARA